MLSTRSKVIIGAGALLVFLLILWVAAWGPGTESGVASPQWSGTMVVQTKAVQVEYDGRVVRCVSDEVLMPGHFNVRVTNSADVPLVCDVAVQRGQASGYREGDPAWLKVAPSPSIGGHLTANIPVRVLLPKDLPNGQYALNIAVSKGQQTGTVTVVLDVERKVAV